MKKVMHYLPVLALVLGGSLALATTNRTMAPNYYRDPVSGMWHELGGIEPGDQPGQYQCNAPFNQLCTAETYVGGVPGGETQNGQFEIVEE